ncbi:winged helix-turn-helix domain-containing protein [Streptomyces sp. NPDC056568]|uniref:winged helix-turn-helix domain-containing protein n=1 Tax=Streptomyces sp. NPDC056568 TaxID=3345866 RepID=UPI00367D1C77
MSPGHAVSTRRRADSRDPGRARLLIRNGWPCQVPARRAMEHNDDAVAGWVKEMWPRAGDSRRPVEPGSCSRTKPDPP